MEEELATNNEYPQSSILTVRGSLKKHARSEVEIHNLNIVQNSFSPVNLLPFEFYLIHGLKEMLKKIQILVSDNPPLKTCHGIFTN